MSKYGAIGGSVKVTGDFGGAKDHYDRPRSDFAGERHVGARNRSVSGGKYFGHRGNRGWRKTRDRYETHVKRKTMKESIAAETR